MSGAYDASSALGRSGSLNRVTDVQGNGKVGVLDATRARYQRALQVDGLSSEMTHLVGRTRAFLLELVASERELRSLGDARAEWVIAAIASARDIDRAGSLARVEVTGTQLLRALRGDDGHR
jgi:hypothetical protein